MVYLKLHEANPDKFQALCVGKRTREAIKSFQLGTTVIECEIKVTLLGVSIDFQLKFSDHISETVEKKKHLNN